MTRHRSPSTPLLLIDEATMPPVDDEPIDEPNLTDTYHGPDHDDELYNALVITPNELGA